MKLKKKAISLLLVVCMVLSLLPAGAAAAQTNETETGFAPAQGQKSAATAADSYTWLDNDRKIEYPASKTGVTTNSNQGGYGPEKMLDNNNGTKWEANWNGTPVQPEITLTLGNTEYVTGFMYMSRLDNNIGGIMMDYTVFASENGTDYAQAPVAEGTLPYKLGIFFVTFDTPVLARSIKIESDARAITELRLTYSPNDYDSLLADAEATRAAITSSGSDVGMWDAAVLDAFDNALVLLKEAGKPEDAEDLRATCVSLFELTRDLKRAKSVSTADLTAAYNQAVILREAAVEGTKPLQWPNAALDAVDALLASVEVVAGASTASQGTAQDTQQALTDGLFTFQRAQVKPAMSTTLTAKNGKSLDALMDGVTESRYQSSGAASDKSKYIELDYQGETQFESLTFYSWFATAQAVKTVQVQVKNGETWNDVDGSKIYTIGWTTNVGSPSDKKTVTFDAPVKGTALRICVVTTGSDSTIDELEVGIGVSEADIRISLNKSTLELLEGQSEQLVATVLPSYATNRNVTWTSSTPEVVSVSADGTVKGIALPQGETTATATITATTVYGGKIATCEVTLSPRGVTDEDKADTVRRVEILDKLATASVENDYTAGALAAFQTDIADMKTKLTNPSLTMGELNLIDQACAAARKTFDESALTPIRTVKELIDRVTGQGSGDRFILEVIPADTESGMDVYEVAWDAGSKKPVLRGNTAGALATAYNYYLKYFAYLDFPYIGDSDLVLPATLPAVSEKVRIVFPYEWRHYFNENCEYKYTTSLYGQDEWTHRLDWLAMNGYNMFLLDIGEHAIWMNVKDELGLNDADIDELLHSNKGTEQYYGVYGISEAAAQQEGELAKFVTQRGFDLGMEPEIRPFVGQIPFMFPNNRADYYETSKRDFVVDQTGSIFDGLTAYPAARWMNLPQGLFISPEVESGKGKDAEKARDAFNKVADIYYNSLMETLGFNEYGRTPVYGYKDMVGEQGFVVNHPAFPKRVVREMSELLLKLNPDSVWMQTSWRYSTWLIEQYKPGSVMFVDLKADNNPKWQGTNEFGGTPWVWSMLFNFGGNTGLGGGFEQLTNGVLNAAETASYMKGVSISPEGGDTNPALYGLMAEMTWRTEAPDMEQWLKDYAKRRYGAENYEKAKTEIDSAWKQLYETVYSDNCPGGADGPSQTIINAYPQLNSTISRYYGTNAKVYASRDIISIWQTMLDAAEKMGSENVTEQFKYDLVDITRQALGDISGDVYAKITPSYQAGDKAETLKYAGLMVDLCEQMDDILSTNRLFLAGTRLNDAKNRGVTETDKAYFEQVERTFMTYWVLDNYDAGGGLRDYCNRHLAGLTKDYYGMRWQKFYDELNQAMTAGSNYNQGTVNDAIKPVVVAWTKSQTPYATTTTGESVDVSRAIMTHYAELIQELYPVDKTSLQALYDANKDRSETGNTTENWAAFQAALTKAKTALDTATTQIPVNEAYAALLEAVSALVVDPTIPNGVYDRWYQDAATVKPNAVDNQALCGTVDSSTGTVLRLTGSNDNGQNDDNNKKPAIFVNDILNAAISATGQNTVSFDFTPDAVFKGTPHGNTSPIPTFGFYMNYIGVNDNYFVGYSGNSWVWQRYGVGADWGNLAGPAVERGKTYSVILKWTGTHMDLFQVGPKNGPMTTVMDGTEAGANMAAGGAGKGFGFRAGYSEWYASLTSLDITNLRYSGQAAKPIYYTVSGKVTNDQVALPNATVTDGTARAITGKDGGYTLYVTETDGVIINVTYPGMTGKTVTVPVDGLWDANVDMALDTAKRPVISEQPADKAVTVGNKAIFTVSANDGATYQWQRSNDSGATWSDIAEAVEGEYAISTTTMSDNGAQFRCKVTASDEGKLSATITSAVATLTVTVASHSLTHHASVPATCTEAGSVEYWECGGCHKYFSDNMGNTEITDIVENPLGHDYGDWEVTTPATCTEDGEKTHVCSNDTNHTETEAIPALGHSFSEDWTKDETDHWHVCSVCDEVDESTRASHIWVLNNETSTSTEKHYECLCGAAKMESITPPPYIPPVSNTDKETVKNADGSTTKTVTDKKTGDKTIITTYPDGSKVVTDAPKNGEAVSKVTVPEGKTAIVTIPAGSGNVAVIVNEDGTEDIIAYSIVTESGVKLLVKENTTVKVIDNSKTFADVAEDAWFAGAVQFAASHELFNGTGDGFSPMADMTRGMLVTVLARLDGQDTTGGDTWYAKGMDWAVENGISDGAAPESSITREQLAAMLYRHAGSPETEGMALSEFSDSADVSAYAESAMRWAVQTGIIKGTDGKLNPAATATRAEVATMLERFVSNSING